MRPCCAAAGIEKKLALAAELRQQLQESSVDARVTRASLKDAQRILTDRNAQLAGERPAPPFAPP